MQCYKPLSLYGIPYERILDAIYTLTEGNPFFIEEILKSLIAAGEVFIFTESGTARSFASYTCHALFKMRSKSAATT